jgi:hypothetical protein
VSDLERCFKALKGKQARYDTLYNYYHGNAPLVYATEKLRSEFSNLTARFSENWCLPPGSPVLTDDGVAAIDEISVGSLVPGHDGNLHAVEAVYGRHTKDALTVFRTYGSPPTSLTGNHPVLATKRETLSTITTKYVVGDDYHFRVYGSGQNVSYRHDSVKREWVRADELRRGDIVWGPAPSQSQDAEHSAGLLRLLGWYVAEGSVSDTGRIAFSLHKKETAYAQEIADLLQSECGLRSSFLMGRGLDMQVVAYSKEWTRRFIALAGRKCDGKKLCSSVMRGPTRDLMLAAWRGDGTTPKLSRAQMVYCTVSLDLAVQMQQMMLREGIQCSWSTKVARGDKRRRTAYLLNVAGDSACRLAAMLDGEGRTPRFTKSPPSVTMDNLVGYAVAETEQIPYDGIVYDLRVADSHSFVLPGCVAVHNCAVVCDSLLERISLEGFKLEDEAASTTIADLWDSLDLSLDSDDIARDVAVTSEAFLLVEQTEDGKVRAFANQPHLCCAMYREDDPREMELAAKWWESGEVTYLTLYYPDRLEHYVAKQKRADISEAKAFSPDPENDEEVNPYGRIPLFHFQRDRQSNYGELQNVMPLQNALNKLFADMMVSAEFGAAPQRYAIMAAGTDASGLKNGPNKVWRIPYDASEGGQRPEVGQFSATQLSNFLDAIDHIASKIAVITRTPKHYLMQQGDVSGEALIAMEAPLTRKAAKYTERLGVTWRQAAQFILSLSGFNVEVNDIEPIWEDVRTVQPLTEAQIRETNMKAGIPIEVQLDREGWTDEELDALFAAEADRTKRETDASDVAREEAMRKFAAGQVPGAPNATVAE